MADRVVKVVLRGEIGDLRAKMTSASKSVKDTADGMTKAGKESDKFRRGLDELGGTAGKVGLAASAGLGMITKSAMDWETAWAGVTKTVDGTASELAELEGQLREMARSLPASHTEIAAVAEAAGQLGVQRDNIASFTKTMIDLGETTNLTADEAATSIAQMTNVMGTSAADIDNLGAALVALGNDGASTEREIIQMAQRISGAGAQIGLAESDILAIANAAASMGIEVEAGGSAISRVFVELAKATAQGGEDLATFAEVADMSADKFTQLFSERPAEAFQAFTEGLNRINQAGGDVFTILDDLGLADVRVSRALLGMAASGDLLADSLELGARAWEENTALAEEAEKRYNTTASQVRVAWNQIKDAAIETGASVLPVVADIAGSVGDIANAFRELPAPVQKATVGLLGITAITGGSLWFGAKVYGAVVDTKQALSDLGWTADKTKTSLLNLRNAARVGAVLGTVALNATDVDEKLGFANTAAYALYGTMILPGWGTAIGAGIGLVQDFGVASEESAAKLERLGQAIDALAEEGDLAGLEAQAAKIRDLVNQIPDDLPGPLANHENIQALRELADEADAAVYATAALEGATLGAAGAADQGAYAVDGQTGSLRDNTEELQENIDKMRERRDEALKALGGRLAYQAALNAPGERLEQRSELQQEIAKAQKEGGADRAKISRDAAERIAELNRRLREAKTEEERARIRRDIAKAQRDESERLDESRRREAERVADLKKRLEDYALTVDETTKAGQENLRMLMDVIAGWNGLSDAEKNARGAHHQAIEDFVKLATQLGMTEEAARDMAWEMMEIPTERDVKIAVDSKQALEAIAAIRSELENIPKNIVIAAEVAFAGVDVGGDLGAALGAPKGKGKQSKATGGWTGPGEKYQPAGVVHADEFVFSKEATHGNVAFLDTLHRSMRGYASGGRVGGSGSVAGLAGIGIDYDRLTAAILRARPLWNTANFYNGREDLERQAAGRGRMGQLDGWGAHV